KELTAICHEEDPTRPTTSAMNSAQPNSPIVSGIDLIGLNYQGAGLFGRNPRYPDFHGAWPGKAVYGSETVDAYSTRGYYTFNTNESSGGRGRGGGDPNHQVSSYDLEHAGWSYIPDVEFAAQARFPYVAGEFVWTGFDYLGEPTPYDSSRSSYSGIVDLAGFKKDRFYLYQSVWRPNYPMAHIVPQDWNWPGRVGQVTPVHIYTSGDEAELFLNGKSLGRKKKGDYEYRLRWDDVKYEPGTLKVVAYKNGKAWATDEVRTTGPAAKLLLQPDRGDASGFVPASSAHLAELLIHRLLSGPAIKADGKDLYFVKVTVADEDGLMVPNAHNQIHFNIEGPGEIVATDNGDPTDFVSFPSHDRKAFNGLCLVIVRGIAGQPGTIKLTAQTEGLQAATAVFKSALK
ncbi:MAG TPA: DUF4982 domain-containing protein, partial [Verrucomicrobiae bacterium]|nr:DUF4982 domain-containing protein [Verrucomicrobiae bacterium]